MEFVTTFGDNKNYYDQQMMVLQQKATEILATCSKRPMIALDLDYTLWPANCFEHTAPPYRSVESRDSTHKEGSGILKEKILCIDRRTGHERSFVLFPHIRSILEWCADHRIVLTIASKSPDLSLVKQIMLAFGMWDWFLFPQIFNSRKTYHFRNLTEATGLKMHDFLFYDDDYNNITMCNRIGITSCLVDKQTGLTWNTFLEGLATYASQNKSATHLSNWLMGESKLSHKGSPTNSDPHSKKTPLSSKTPSPRISIVLAGNIQPITTSTPLVLSAPPTIVPPSLTVPIPSTLETKESK